MPPFSVPQQTAILDTCPAQDPPRLTVRRLVIPYGVPAHSWDEVTGGPPDPHPAGQPALPILEDDPVVEECGPVPPAVRGAAVLLSRTLVEALRGLRPPQQLARWFEEDALTVIIDRARADRHQPPVVLASVRVQMPHPEAAEVSLRLSRGQRSGAAAMRLQRESGRWYVSDLIVLPG
mgnify:CR=1 FL=1